MSCSSLLLDAIRQALATVYAQRWRERAACKGMDTNLFFPHDTLSLDRWDEPRAVCVGCPVRQDCLNFTLELDDLDDKWGMFGGMTPGERRVLRDQRRRTP